MIAAMNARAILCIFCLSAITPAEAQPVAEKSGPAASQAVYADRLDAAYAWLRQARDGREADAARLAVAGLLVKPASPTAEALLAQVNMALSGGARDASEALLDRLRQSWPEDPVVYLLRGRLRELQGRQQDALSDYRESARLEPRNIEALLSEGIILRDLGRKDEALKVFHNVLAIAPQLEEAKALAVEMEKLSRDL